MKFRKNMSDDISRFSQDDFEQIMEFLDESQSVNSIPEINKENQQIQLNQNINNHFIPSLGSVFPPLNNLDSTGTPFSSLNSMFPNLNQQIFPSSYPPIFSNSSPFYLSSQYNNPIISNKNTTTTTTANMNTINNNNNNNNNNNKNQSNNNDNNNKNQSNNNDNNNNFTNKSKPLSPQLTGFFKEQKIINISESSFNNLLNKLFPFKLAQEEQLEQMRQIQKQVLLNPTKETFEMLKNQQIQLKKQIDAELKALSELGQSVILGPHEIKKAFDLHQELQVQNMQLELFHQELNHLLQIGSPQRCYAALVIVEQPLPMVITKGKPLEEPIVVKLLTGANISIQSISSVKAILLMDNPQIKGTNTKNMESDTEIMDDFQHSAKFYLKFLNGTRKTIANLKFLTQIQLSGGQTISLDSNISNPFVVITNECQYEESDGLLLKLDAFGQQADSFVSWPLFANLLQRYFLRGTRQDSMKPQRFLSKVELQYLNQKFFGGNQIITSKMFDDFWCWFGKGLQKIRYQRHLCSMWQSGLIYGFISREGVNDALVNQEVGTFLIRFSERHPGTFAVGYVINDPNPDKRVRHYLIRPEDVYANKKTLPDFLMENSQFQKFLQVSYDLNTGLGRHRIIEKELVLESYGIKRNNPDQPINGYDPSLIGAKQNLNNNNLEE